MPSLRNIRDRDRMKWDGACRGNRFDHIEYIKYHQQYVARQLAIVNTDGVFTIQSPWHNCRSCSARPESNKDEIWCCRKKTHPPQSCLLWLTGIWQDEEGLWVVVWVEGRLASFLPVCPVCVSVQYLKTTHARLCYSQLPRSWQSNWKTSSENNKESLAGCVRCQ